ncbi:hypothetical protein KQI52_03240 [bacterium]|nr:hypothetical protein [bacterium]
MNTARRTTIVVFILMLLTPCMFAQPPQVLWQRTFSQLPGVNYPASIVQAPDGNLIFGRTYHIGTNDKAAEVIKATADGELIWRNGVDFVEGIYTFAHDVGVDTSGNAWLFGLYNIPWNGQYPLLANYDNSGDRQWQRVARSMREIPVRITPLNDGGAALVAKGGVIARVDDLGHLIWQVDLDSTEAFVRMADVIEYQGGLLFAGSWENYGLDEVLYFVHTNLDGDIIWEAHSTHAGPNMKGLLELEDGAFVALSYSPADQLSLNWFEANGIYVTHVNFNLYRKSDWGPEDNYSLALDRMPDGGFLIGGESDQHQAKLIRTDSDGNILWQMVNDGEIYHTVITDVIRLEDGRIQCIGMKRYGGWTTWLIQLAAEGEVIDAAPVELPPVEW